MHACLRLDLSEFDASFFDDMQNKSLAKRVLWELAKTELNRVHNETEKNLRDIVTNGLIDGSQAQERWFPQQRCDVFISHSHRDVELAKGLAIWLQAHFGVTSFIDSQVWGNYEDLLRQVDDKYCYNSSMDTYKYELRNRSTSHVHAILTNAILNAMDNTECVLFLNTENAIMPARDTVSSYRTASPWIYTELEVARLLRRKPTDRLIMEKNARMDSMAMVTHEVQIDHFDTLYMEDLLYIHAICRSKDKWAFLDALYDRAVKNSL